MFITALIAASLFVEPQTSLIDQDLTLRIDQLNPFQIVRVEAKSTDIKGEIWSSQASYQANGEGNINLNAQPPLLGSSYQVVDNMGLFWSMLPSSPSSSYKCSDNTLKIELTLFEEHKISDSKTIYRHLQTPDIQRKEIREEGLVAVLFTPPSQSPLPVIITLSGSNGGFGENRAKLLASRRFAVLALGYFGMEGLPSNLQNIPLEYFEKAFSWIKKQPTIDSTRVGLYGTSRGGELSLLLGSYFPHSIQAIAAIVPSCVVYGGLSEKPINAWIYQNKPILPLAPVPPAIFSESFGQSPDHPAGTREQFLKGMEDQKAFQAASIPVENIQCPLLLVSGGDDQMWPSSHYARKIMERLEYYHSPITRHHLDYPEAGHGIALPNLPCVSTTYFHPVGKLWFNMGGSRAADAKASRDSWKKIVEFFQKNLSDIKP